ncbi:MAG TPA: autotransporter outer membrane beta-barrel domain-containing protein [Bauldia sp.]|nr:autotransporter outer membrane beta-barrel domain-containing protein [Bauldia sp.]
MRGGSLAWLALTAATTKPRRLSRAGALTALVGGVLALLPAQAAIAGCAKSGQVWNCTANGTVSGSPQALIQPTANGWQVNAGVSGTADTYRDTGNFQSNGSDKSQWNLGVLEIFNTNESGTVTVSSGSTLAGQQADGIRFYDTVDGTPTITFNVYGKVLGGTRAWTVTPPEAQPGDGIHVGRSGVNSVDPEYTMGSFLLNVGSASETGAVVEGGDNGVYIAQGVSTLASVTNYGTIIGVGNRNPTNWGEGVHISRVAKGQGDTYQITGAATVLNYGDIEGHAAGGVAEGDADGPGSGVNVSADGNILIGNESGTIVGTDGVVAYGGGTNAITVENTGHVEGTYGNGITVTHGGVGAITNHSFHSVIGSGGVNSNGVDAEDFHQVVFDNEGGLTAGLTGSGAYIANISGAGESGDAVHVVNTEAGLIAGYTGGLVIQNVTGNTTESEANNVYIDNRATWISGGDYAAGGLIVGVDGAGISVSDVAAGIVGSESAAISGSVTIDNQDTRHTAIDLGAITDASVYSEGDPSTGLLGTFADNYGGGGESILTGIYGTEGIHVSEAGGGVTVNNQDGLVIGTDGDGVYLDSIGGAIAINNGRSWYHGDGGLIEGTDSGISISKFYGSATVDNVYGTISGSVNGVVITDADGAGQFVTVKNESGSITASGSNGAGVNLAVNGTSVVAIDNSRAGHHDSEGGVISGGLYGVAVTGGALVDIDNAHGAIYASESGTGAGVALTDVGHVYVGNTGGSIYDNFADSDGINMYGVGEGADIDNAASWHSAGGYIAGTYHGIAGADIEGGVTVENADGVVVGSEGDGIRFATVLSSNEAGYAVAIDNSSTWGHNGGVIAGLDNGVVINTIGSSYAAGDNIVAIDNSGYLSSEHDHAGGLIAGTLGDGVAVFNTESDVQIYNAYTRANGGLDIGESGVGAAAAGLLSPLAEAGDDFLSPGSTGIWGLAGSGVYGTNIAGSVYIDNRQGQIVGLADDRAAVELDGVGGGLTPAESGIAVNIDNSNTALASEGGIGDFSRYSLLTGGDYGVKLSAISNGDIVFNNDYGVAYGDEMAFALNGLTEGDVLITNSAGMMEGHNGSSPMFASRDSYGAVTIANVDGHVEIDNGSSEGGVGGEIVGVDSASAIYLAGNVTSATIYNDNPYFSESDDQAFGGLVIGSGTEANPVIVLDTSTSESGTANGIILNHGVIASTNLLGFSDPDVTGAFTDLTQVANAIDWTAYYLDGGALPAWGSESASYEDALAAIDHHNAGADGVSAARDLAVQSETGAVEIDNAAAIIGRVDLAGYNLASEGGVVANVFNNNGFWFTEGANYLGSGGVINNDGVIQTAFGSEGDLNTSFDVADFHNDSNVAVGILSMLDGIAGNTVTVTGNFHGSADEAENAYSYVALDAYLDASVSEGGTPSADVLHVEGNVDGTTGLVINNLNTTPINAMNTDGIKVVQVDGTSESCAGIACRDGDPFYISSKSTGYLEINGTGTIEQGLYAWYLTDPGESGHEYDLVTAALPTDNQAPELITAFANIFYNGITDMVAEHIYGGAFDPTGGAGADVSAVEQPPDHKPSGAMWGRVSGTWSRQDTTVTTGLGPVDTGFNQNTYTMLGGLDLSPSADGGGLRFGAYAGYVTSDADFDAYAATGKYTGGVAGGYLAYTKDDFYVDGQISADFVNLAFNAPLGVGVNGNVNGTTWGILADTGKRFYAGSSFLEPMASFAYADTTLGDMQSGTATITFSNGESVRGGLGARIGVAATDSSGVHVELSLLGRVWDEFSGNNLVTVSDGANTDTFTDDTSGLSGEVSASATLVSPDRSTSVFAAGGATFKADATALNARAGLRKSF